MRRSKYNTRPSSHNRCNQDHGHGSRAEATYCDNLHFEMQDLNADSQYRITEIEKEPRIALVAGRQWWPDFRVWRNIPQSCQPLNLSEPFGLQQVKSYLVDVKGKRTELFKFKFAVYKELYENGKVTEPVLIEHVHQSKGSTWFTAEWFPECPEWYPKSAGERR